MTQFRSKHALTRRGFTVVLAALTLSAGLCSMVLNAATISGNASSELVYIGMQGNQIRAMRFDPSNGNLAMIGPVAEGPRPTWIISNPQLPVLYAVNDDNTVDGSVTAFSIDRASGALDKLNEVATGGNGTTYLSLDTPSKTLLAANFASGSVSSISLRQDGSLGELISNIKETGSGPHRRQTRSHAHSIVIDPSGTYALVPDLGADRVFIYGFDRATHTIKADDPDHPRAFATPPGSGPRHLAFGADGRFVYLLNELTAEVMTLRWDAQQGKLTQVQLLSTTSAGFEGTKSGAEIAVGRDGRFVYVENRGENTMLVYRVNPDSGELTQVQSISSGGQVPWSFAIHPSGKWLLVANQRSAKINVFSIDPANGLLSDTGHSVATLAPVSVTFVP